MVYDNFELGISIDTVGVSMEIRLLKAFQVLAEELNFRKAADRLNMSQPPLTRLISQMELDLGVPLFRRTTRHVELTGAGLHLLKKSREILSLINQTELEVRSLTKLKSGALEVSLSWSALHSEVPRLISLFKEQFPKIQIKLSESNPITLASKLKTGKYDLAFGVNEFNDHSLKCLSVQTQELGLLVSQEHPLARKKMIRLNELEGETLIFHSKHERLGFQMEFLDYLNGKDIFPRVYYKKSKESCSKLVSEDKGLLLSAKSMAHASSDSVYVPFAEYKPKLRIFAQYSEENPSLALKAFINFIEERKSAPALEAGAHF